MTDAAGGVPDEDHDESHDDAEGDGLKDESSIAEESDVHDGIAGQPRLTWSSVTDTGGAPRPPADEADPTDRSSFRFDLGGALARLGSDEAPEPADSPPHREPDPMPATDPAPASAAPSVTAPAPASPSAPEPIDESTIRRLDATFAAEAPIARDEPLIDLGRLDAAAPAQPVAPMAPATPTPVEQAAPVTSPAPVEQAAPVTSPAPVEQAAPVAEPPRAEPAAETPADVTAYPRRVPGTHLDPHHRIDDGTQTAMPEIREATSADEAPRRMTQRSSVFGDAGQDNPIVPVESSLAGTANLPRASSAAMPSLPASNPSAPPAVIDPVGGSASIPDANALRSAQLKASRQKRQGKLFGRSLLAFVGVGGLIAAAMVFGRSLLFSTDWAAELTPIVNEIETDRGASFDRTVSLSTLTADDFGERLRTATIGDAWVDSVPEWRALNLTVGTVTAESVAAEMVRETTAFYDAASDSILLVVDVTADESRDDLRLALESAYDRQQGAAPDGAEVEAVSDGFVGVSSPTLIAERAIDSFLANRTAEREPANESLPIPIAYELAAVNTLGEPILVAAGVDPTTLTLASPTPDGVADVLGDAPVNTASGLLQPGDSSLADPVALGTDDWSLVWATRLPEDTVARLIDQVTADSYRAIERNGNTCVIGVFETLDEGAANSVFAAMLTWAAAAPPASQAIATQLGTNRVQIEACDPGVDNGVASGPGVVDALIDRQQRRLTN